MSCRPRTKSLASGAEETRERPCSRSESYRRFLRALVPVSQSAVTLHRLLRFCAARAYRESRVMVTINQQVATLTLKHSRAERHLLPVTTTAASLRRIAR